MHRTKLNGTGTFCSTMTLRTAMQIHEAPYNVLCIPHCSSPDKFKTDMAENCLIATARVH